MNQRLSKKLRQYSRRNWREFLDTFWNEVGKQSLRTRIGLAWKMLWVGHRHKKALLKRVTRRKKRV